MPDTIDGTIQDMRALDPASSLAPQVNGQIFRTRENDHPKRESIFVWDSTPYDGPLYNRGVLQADDEVPQYVGFAPDINNLRDGSSGVWRWVDPPYGSIDAERVYGISPHAIAQENGKQFQRCVDEVLAATTYWPRPDPDPNPGKGDSWTVRLPAGTIELDRPIVFNRKTARTSGPPNFPDCTYNDERVTVAGRIVLQGQGASTTRLTYVGLATDVHAFRVGPLPDDELPEQEPERHGSGCVFLHIGRFVLRDLALDAATDAGFAVLRLAQTRGHNLLENVDLTQRGNGDGINATEILFTQFIQVNVTRSLANSPYPGQLLGYSGRGLWIHTDDAPYFISGQSVLNRVSVFGHFTEGIVLGENQGDRLLGSLAGQFINAEHCLEGLVVGRGAVNVDFSVLWLENNRVCGVRIFDGAKDVTLRRIYTLQTAPEVTGALEASSLIDYNFEGEILLGKKDGTAGQNSYESIVLDGIYQQFVYGPVVRAYRAASGGLVRNLVVRDVHLLWYRDAAAGALHPSRMEEGAESEEPPAQDFVYPFTDAIVKLEPGDYGGLTVENIRSDHNGSLPNQGSPSGPRITYVDHPASVDRLVFCGPYDALVSYGLREVRKAAPALRERRHTASASIRPSDPTYHRVTTTSAVTLTLPDITLEANNVVSAEGRVGLEYHVLKVAAGSAVTLKGRSGQPVKGLGVTSSQVVLSNTYEFVRVRSVEEGESRFWEVIALGKS